MLCEQTGCGGCSCKTEHSCNDHDKIKIKTNKKKKGNFSKTFNFALKVSPAFSLTLVFYYYIVLYFWQNKNPLWALAILVTGSFFFYKGLKKFYALCAQERKIFLFAFYATIFISLSALGYMLSFVFFPLFAITKVLTAQILFAFVFSLGAGYLYMRGIKNFLAKPEAKENCACG